MKAKTTSLILATIITMAISANAAPQPNQKQDTQQQKKQATICDQDIDKYCMQEKQGGNVYHCLVNNINSLSPDCQERTRDRMARKQAVSNNCGPDQQKYCPGTDNRQRMTINCLMENIDRLSTDCREAVKMATRPSNKARQHN